MNERIPRIEPDEQLNGPITRGPFSSPLLAEVMSKFGRTAFGRSSACMEFEDFIENIAYSGKNLQMIKTSRLAREVPRIGSTCLEIGTMHGVTAIVLSQFFDNVVCVSVDVDKHKILKHKLCEHLGITNIKFHDVDNNEQKAKIVNRLDFDFCYSDGDHARDAKSDFDLVKRCGRVLQHEAWPIQPPVWNLLHSLPENEVTWANYDCFAYWHKEK